jgi:hypothetical protein
MASYHDEIIKTAQEAYYLDFLPVSILPNQKHPGFKGHSNVYDGQPRPTWSQVRDLFRTSTRG